MKTFKILKPFILFLTMVSIYSCNNDINLENELVGVWQRSDFNENFEYKLHLNSDNTGLRTSTEYYRDQKAISNAVMVIWSTNDNQLTLLIGDESFNTLYSFNTEGQLLLSSLTEFPFNKLE